ncbi:MAG: hypothetical protein SGPRY_004989, partial [Prymnesium sp.]
TAGSSSARSPAPRTGGRLQASKREATHRVEILRIDDARDRYPDPILKVSTSLRLLRIAGQIQIKIREELLCPITAELMLDPVFTADGQTYERGAIECWLEEHDTSPLTVIIPSFLKRENPMDIGEQLEHLGLTPNVLVRGMCRKYLEQVLTLPFDNLILNSNL